MKKGLLIVTAALLYMACNKSEVDESEAIKQAYHGKYEIISSHAFEAVDLNMDGIASTNLLLENSQLTNAHIEYRNYKPDALFAYSWPIESFNIPLGLIMDSSSYQSDYVLNYNFYGMVLKCEFNDDFSSLRLLDELEINTPNTLVSIESITTVGPDIIEVTALRKLYTINGFVTMRIVSQYQRYTRIT